MAFGRMGEGPVPAGTAPSMTTDLLNLGMSVVNAQTAKKIAEQQAEAARQTNKAAMAQAAAISNQSSAAQNIAAMNAQAMSANTKRWMWIIGGSVVGLVVLGVVYFKFIRK